jgi:hypothetical protein
MAAPQTQRALRANLTYQNYGDQDPRRRRSTEPEKVEEVVEDEEDKYVILNLFNTIQR